MVFAQSNGTYTQRTTLITHILIDKIGHINLIISFSSPPALPFFLPRLDIFAPLLAECSCPAPFKVSTYLEQPKKIE